MHEQRVVRRAADGTKTQGETLKTTGSKRSNNAIKADQNLNNHRPDGCVAGEKSFSLCPFYLGTVQSAVCAHDIHARALTPLNSIAQSVFKKGHPMQCKFAYRGGR